MIIVCDATWNFQAVQAGLIPGVPNQQTLYPNLAMANQQQLALANQQQQLGQQLGNQLGLTMGMANQQPVYQQVVQQPAGFAQQATTYTTTVNGVPNQIVTQQHLIPSLLQPVTTVMHHIIQIPKTVQGYFNRAMNRQGSSLNNNSNHYNNNNNRLSRNSNSRYSSGSRSNIVYNQEPVITHTSVPY